ncbi:dihydroorotase [Eubacterium ventriosum]|uniref:Dihydroorotase n=1 Tax=Eubacterium ventriosum TaxID=39496 RepID=A0A415L7U2_9FIRM|nr:dihydroorotase [Eubacterium ventriosum]RHF87874.1 dihydroorotase [Eubacterium ventriosum]RHL44548.1 dihydroorotase [Eubacterium ventriosum]
MTILIKNGRLINPSENLDKVMDIFVEDGIIKEKAESIEKQADTVIDAAGCYVMPGLIDLHVHFRDPGLTYKEDIETGSKAAAKGGFTTVCCMPNTKPVVDNVETVKYIIEKGKKVGLTNVLPVGAVTKNMAGVEITDVEELKKAGICAISEDGKSVMNSGVYRKAMKNAAKANVPVLAHCEDINLVEGGVINLGDKSSELGVKGISNAVEDVIAMRDIMLAKETGATLHLCHCSTKDSVEMVKRAKEEGIKVTAEVCPHHFSMCSDDITSNDGNFKMNPPLRAREDMEALIKGLQDDIMDVISTDHAPHSAEEKAKDLEHAPFGIVGLETSVALTVTNLVKKGYLTPMQMAAKMSYNPAKVLGIPKGTLDEGKIADITIIDPDKEYTIDVNTFESKGKNTPFDGYKVSGEVEYTILNGKVVYSNK